MAEATRLVRDDEYEEIGAAYQCIQIATLDAALQEHNIGDETLRRKVCASFLFALGSFHDQGWLKVGAGGERLYPILCFSRQFLNVDVPADQLGVVYAPSEGFAYHEYAFGCISAFYAGEPAARVETGNFSSEQDA